MNRRRFTLAALFPATFLAGCRSETEPARDATLFHNRDVRNAVSELEQGLNGLEMGIGAFNAENWQDALEDVRTATTRLRHDLDELRSALGYKDES